MAVGELQRTWELGSAAESPLRFVRSPSLRTWATDAAGGVLGGDRVASGLGSGIANPAGSVGPLDRHEIPGAVIDGAGWRS